MSITMHKKESKRHWGSKADILFWGQEGCIAFNIFLSFCFRSYLLL